MQVHCLVNSDISALESNGRTELQAIPLVSACAIPRSRFAIALAQSNLRAIAIYQFNLPAIALGQSNLRVIAPYQSNLRAIALGQPNLQAIALYQSNL
jgi:hypothetical protein